MKQAEKLRCLRVALIVFGALFVAGIYTMMMWVWPSGWLDGRNMRLPGRGWWPAVPANLYDTVCVAFERG